MNYKLLTFLVFAFFYSFSVQAQVSITGTVSDSDTGELLPGVNVFIQQLQRGDATDIDGEFEITDLSPGTYTIVATFIGYNRYEQQITVGSTNINLDIELTAELTALDDVVVTAFGIQREARALGYGVSSISAENIQDRLEVDAARTISGKIAGVNVGQTGGMTGSPTSINIRGFTSITGTNQPLIVVDGVRFDSQQDIMGQFGEGFGSGGQGITRSSRFLDLDPNNIEDITVLKGLSATTVYGSEGKNGVILITTKSASGNLDDAPGWEANFEQGFYATQISTRPDYQDEYGIGFDQAFGWFFSNWGPRFDETDPSVFGDLFMGFDEDGTPLVQHPTQSSSAGQAGFPEFADIPYRYQPYPDPISAFFRTGIQSNTSFNLSGGTEGLRLGLTFSHLTEDGFTPGDEMTRNNFSISANYRVTSRLTARTSFNLALVDRIHPPVGVSAGSNPIGDAASIFGNVMYTPRSIDLAGLPFNNPIDNSPIYYRANNDVQNPFWTVENHFQSEYISRNFGVFETNYEVMDGLNLVYRLGYDSWNDESEYRQNQGSVQISNPDGLYETVNRNFRSLDHQINAMYDYRISEDFHISGLAGAQLLTSNFERTGLSSQNQIVYGIFSHNNYIDSSTSSFFGGNFHLVNEQETLGVFLTSSISFRDYAYLTLGARNDWFSTLESGNRGIIYPSASVSFIASDAFNITSDFLTYLKLYGGIGTSAGGPSPYTTRNVLASNARAFLDHNGNVQTSNSTSNLLGNPNLKPELITEYDFGIEGRLFNNRIGLDVSVFHRDISDFLVSAPLDPTTGFTATMVNVGNMEYQGLELTLDTNPYRTQNFNWTIDANFYTDRSKVNELGAGLERIQLPGGFTNLGGFIEVGEPYGIIMGTQVLRDEASGQMVVNSNGDYIATDEIGKIGNPNPDYTLSFSNRFTYRGASISFQIDYQHGGDMYSTWIGTLLGRGLTTSTAAVDRNNTFILPGVKEDGSINDIQISASDMFFGNYGLAGPDELRVFDMTHLRLSELAFSYSLPVQLLQNVPIRSVSITLVANNLWLRAFNVPQDTGFDPAVNSISGTGNTRGLEFITGPNVTRFGGSIRIGL